MSEKPEPSGNDDEWPLAPEPDQPPPGKALIAYRRARIVRRFDRRVAEIEFSIIEPIDWQGFRVVLYCALPAEGPARRAGKFYALWTMANGASPNRRDRMSPRVFAGYWWAELERSREGQGNTHVGCLIERAAGGPQN